ncbi:CLUMA_CG004518, isoform A [Clunio marinus]|uniref:CLUMA_CG004518, isoform A n=1 Tax=Clunio marinus TaxID=568069 RepID=A0A1J1HTY2_9DIPT|nr:CLUMA_CG004518, isoform A [Clunio marinus]
MSEATSFSDKFRECKSNKERTKLLEKVKTDDLCDAIVDNAAEDLGLNIWSSVLSNLSDEDEIFEICKDVLPKLNRDQLTTKNLNDYYSRLCIEIPRFSLKFSVKLAYFCENSIQFGDHRACFFKDVFPCILQVLIRDDRPITFDGVTKSSLEYHQMIISSILSKPFKVSVLTSITSMFKDIPLTKLQSELLLGKICENFSNIRGDISGLALACFNLALFNKLIIPILALDAYFYNRRYRKKFIEIDSESDADSIDETAEKGIIETEENVLYHFQHVTEFTSIEKDIVTSLKPLAFAPKFIISPFIATILVSFAKMSSSSVAHNLRLPQSILLPFIKQIFKNNERHRTIHRNSAWARSVDQFEPVDIEKLLKVLQENTCKLGQNIALNGFIGLTFMLLKTKDAPTLNNFAIQFLNELVKQRSEFTSDIMKIVVKMLFNEQNKAPIIECFSILIQNRSLVIDRCEEALVELIENLTELELDTALAIESVIYSSITRSPKLRDLMSTTMRTAMYQNKPEMRKLAVYSFCVMLKKVMKAAHGSSLESFAPSQNISMMSLLSQTQLPPTEKANMRRVSVLVLEILGILRKCFSHSVELRVTLYESLLSAVTVNPFIIPNVLELVETHFRDYFDSEDPSVVINFSKAFKQLEHGGTVVMDHLGKFLNFFIGCVTISIEKFENDENAQYIQIMNYKKIIEKLVDKVEFVTMEELGVFSTLDIAASSTISQFLNCLEALMVYCLFDLTSKNVTRLCKLFEKHRKTIVEALKLQENCKKSIKRGKNQTLDVLPKVDIIFDCLWDLKTCRNFLKIFFDNIPNDKVNEIKSNAEFCRFVVKSTTQRILQITTAPVYLKFKHSKITFDILKTISTILYKQIKVETFKVLFVDYDAETAVAISEAFKNSIIAMDSAYDSNVKWNNFLQKITETENSIDWMITEVLKTVTNIIEWAFDPSNELENDDNIEKILFNVFCIFEVLIKNYQFMPNAHSRETYNWLLKFCVNNEINKKSLQIVNRVLFHFMTQQDASTNVMENVVGKLLRIYGTIDNDGVKEVNESSQNDLKSLTEATADQSLIYFVGIIKKQIDDVDFCILRMNSFNAHIKLPGQVSRKDSISALQTLEKSSVIKLTQLGTIIGRLCNVSFNVRGSQIDLIGKLVMNFFVCLSTLLKHFSQHYDVKNINYQQIPVEMLIKETKSTVKRVYALSHYIEDIIDEEQKKNENAKESKKKKSVTIKEFKCMSRLVLSIEKFATAVQKFDALTKKNFKKYVHAGEVRDFRISMKDKFPRQAQDENDSDGASAEMSESENDPASATVEEENSRDSDEKMYESPKKITHGAFEKNVKKLVAKAERAKKAVKRKSK